MGSLDAQLLSAHIHTRIVNFGSYKPTEKYITKSEDDEPQCPRSEGISNERDKQKYGFFFFFLKGPKSP